MVPLSRPLIVVAPTLDNVFISLPTACRMENCRRVMFVQHKVIISWKRIATCQVSTFVKTMFNIVWKLDFGIKVLNHTTLYGIAI